MAAKKSTVKDYVLAKSDDGTVQITFTIANSAINTTKDEVAIALSADVEIPGFRKGKAPKSKVLASINKEKLVNEILARILPKLLAKAIKDEKLRLAIYPKFELIKAEDDRDWEVRGVSAEVPEINLGDYKQSLRQSLKKHIKASNSKPNSAKATLGKEEKESQILKALLDNIKLNIPHILIDEEVNRRLSQLLERIEKLGLNLDSYLASIGKTPEKIREEYHSQAHTAIALELILSKIAEKEGVSITDKKIDETIKASTPEKDIETALKNEEQRSVVRSVLKRRTVIDSLVSLV